jgi:hypothetical protein
MTVFEEEQRSLAGKRSESQIFFFSSNNGDWLVGRDDFAFLPSLAATFWFLH